MRRVTIAVASLGLALMAQAQTVRNFELTPEQVVPASASTALGHGAATLNAGQTEISFLVQHDVPDPANATASVHVADWGSNGPIVFTLNNVTSNSFNGTWPVTAGDVANFSAGRLYLQIVTPAYPAGAIRGQIDLNPSPEPGDVIITEIMYNPASQEGGGIIGQPPFTANPEWIELFNTTFTDIQIGGWFFQDEDVDTNGDACTPMRGGAFPDFVLRSFTTVVVIPDGEVINGFAPSVADFKAAWGLGAGDPVIQVDTNGTAGGAIVGRNLSNDPANDTFDINDLPLDAPFWFPCDPFGPERTDNEILTLSDGSQIIDVVNYDDHFPFTSLWPEVGGYNSITIVPDDYPSATSFESYTGTGNDNGANWIAHELGDNALGFKQVAAVGVYGGEDVGSPCRLRGVTSANLLPAAIPTQELMVPAQTLDVFMQGSDLTRPFFGLLLYIIKSLPEHGQLIDVASNKVITPAMLGANGYLMPRLPFNHVRYINDGTCGVDSFDFITYDGVLQSPQATVELFVQCGDVIITEVMYNPDSLEENPSMAEWVELYNTTDAPINLAGWYLADNFSRSGDFPAYILGAHSTVVAIPAVTDAAEFEQAWSAPTLHITTNGQVGNGGVAGSNLQNGGESLRLVKPGGSMLQVTDAVFYRNGFESAVPAWPKLSPDGPSIYLLAESGYSAGANDAPENWGKSIVGLDGAYPVTNTTVYNGFDEGSPGYLADVYQGSCSATAPLFDGNGNGAVAFEDFQHFLMCHQGPQQPIPANCDCFDADADGDVDLRDANLFLQAMYTLVPPISELRITEVLDGTLTNGEPKFIELTNCGDTPIDLSQYRIALYANGLIEENFLSMPYGAMTGVLAAGASFVIANSNSGPGDSYFSIYGEEADLYHGVANGNGNDAYYLYMNNGAFGDILLDAFGVRGEDGTGTAWEYLDSHAESLPGRLPNRGFFDTADWSWAGPNAFDGFTPAQIQAATSAGTHTCD